MESPESSYCFNDDDLSTEDLLYEYLEVHFGTSLDTPISSPTEFYCDDSLNVFIPVPNANPFNLEETTLDNSAIQLTLNGFSDLQAALKDISQGPTSHPQSLSSPKPFVQIIDDPSNDKRWSSAEEEPVQVESTELTVPYSVRVNVESSYMLDSLMYRAISHWCCIGFKVAPISLDIIRNWRNAPPAIVYCVASISLVTFMDHSPDQAFVKQAAMAFYEQARRKMDDVFLDDMQPTVIQAYFCLSYTSNLLRLYEQQRTWGSLACIALQQHAKDIAAGKPIDRMTFMCWLRWYYVDAWLSLTHNHECLLRDETPFSKLTISREDMEHPEFQSLYQFAVLTKYMRMYIQAIQSGTIYGSHDHRYPSAYYHQITQELTIWYQQRLPPSSEQHPSTEIHFHLCYHAMRLIVLFQFLHPTQSPPRDILIDCLETNLSLLQSLEHLKDLGCDQSTYHHMFFAIHNTAKRVYSYSDVPNLRSLAEDQLRINFMMLRGTQAYSNDVFKARLYAEKIEEQFQMLDIRSNHLTCLTLPPPVARFQPTPSNVASTTNSSSRIVVFRQNDLRIRKKPAPSTYSKKVAMDSSRLQHNYIQASV